MFPFLSFATGGKALGWIYPLVPFPGPSRAGGPCVCTCICLFLSRLAPAAVRCSSLVAWGKTEHASYEKVFLKGCLKWHRTQGLMSNLSKPGVNAAAEACGAAEALRKAGAPGCYPTASLGEETSPDPPPAALHYAGFALWVRLGTGARRPITVWRSVEMRSGLCLPLSERYCSFNYLSGYFTSVLSN